MNNNSLSHYRVARSVARVLGSNDEQQCLDELCNQQRTSVDLQSDLEVTWRALANMEELASDDDIKQLLSLERYQPPKESYLPNRKKGFWMVATAVIFSISLVFLLLPTEDTSITTDVKRFVTQIGEQKTVVLEDGTELTLNTGTELLVDMKDSQRRVVLRRGEAYFDVAKDPLRRFVVEIGEKSVSVLGTEFNLYSKSTGFSLSVAEGEVALHSVSEPVITSAYPVTTSQQLSLLDDEQRRIKAGWSVEYNHAQRTLTARQTGDSETSGWRTGLLQFVDVPLMSVVKELNRYSAKKILIEDPSIMSKPVTATVRLNSINSALKGLAKAQSLSLIYNIDHVVIVGAK